MENISYTTTMYNNYTTLLPCGEIHMNETYHIGPTPYE